ncbi:MAG TPA: hypothetical protein VMU48_13645 [Terracidiphilus sp.]|nr:hypothetical protein [Terracidiphilus sp.]
MKRIALFSVLCLSILAIPAAQAQITLPLKADIQHQFTVGQTTLPPGEYVFRMLEGSSLNAMIVTNKDNDTSVEFLVRNSIDSHVPQHSELMFNRYGTKEFLTNLYDRGEKLGVAVIEPSREESRLLREGRQGVPHTEEEPD